MDFPVEATVHVHRFQDEREVRSLLQAHGFKVMDLGRGQVRVEGSFQRLKDVRTRLERLLETPPPLRSSSDPPPASSGAISKYYSRNKTDEGRGRPPDSSHLTGGQDPRTASGPKHQEPDCGTPGEPIVVDFDVYRYAKHFRKLDNLLTRRDVRLCVKESEESAIITLQGRNSGVASEELQGLLDDLSRSLRTQEVPLTDLSSDWERLLTTIRENDDTYASVLVCEMNDGLHLIGPSKESYILKQRLQAAAVDQSEGRGRVARRINRGRSSSVPARNQRSSAGGDGGAAAASSKDDDDDDDAGRREPPRGRSGSESRGKQRAEKEEEKLRRNENKLLTDSERSGFFRSAGKAVRWFKRSKKRKENH